MKQKWLLFITLLLVYSCSQEEDISTESITAEPCTVEFTPACVIGALTKATPIVSVLPKNTQVGISAYLISSDTEAVDYSQSKLFTVTDDAGTLTPAGSSISLFKNTRYNFYAYSPAIEFKNDSRKIIKIPNGTDFKIASIASTLNETSNTVTLPSMSRKCSLVEFLIQRLTTNVLVENIGIGSNGLTLGQLTHSPLDYTLGDGNIKIDGVAQDGSVTMPEANFTAVVPGTQYLVGSVLLPKVSNAFTLNLEALISNQVVPLVATIPAIAFAPGYRYLYTIEISDDAIKIFLVIKWNESSTNADIGSADTKIEVGSWNMKINTTIVGGNNGNVTISDWIVNSNWAAQLGASNTNGSVTGWKSAIFSTNAGGSNTSGTNVDDWNPWNINILGGSNNSTSNINDWNGTSYSTTAGASNTNNNVNGWGNSGSSISSGSGNATDGVNNWFGVTQNTDMGL